MALPLALVSGSYFILSIYYYLFLSFLHLHHHQAQGEPAVEAFATDNIPCCCCCRKLLLVVASANIPFQDDDAGSTIAICAILSLLHPYSMGLLCQAPIISSRDTMMELSSSQRRVWDPGISTMALPFALVSGGSYFILSIYYYPILSSLHLHEAFVGTCSRWIDRDGGSSPSTDTSIDAAVNIERLFNTSQSQANRIFRSLFHYCHPSLSRPTVPNI